MSSTQTTSHYAAHCREVCEWCAKGLRVEPFIEGPVHIVLDKQNRIFGTEICVAPTLEQFAEQQARIAEIRKAKLETLERGMRKRREQVRELRRELEEMGRDLCDLQESDGYLTMRHGLNT